MGTISARTAIGNAPAGLAPALDWFHKMTGQTVAWPDPAPVPGVDRLVCRPKGIYKPRGFDVALSVRESLEGPYDDKRIVSDSEGGWRYDYFQEGLTPAARDREYTNVALMENIRMRSPVGVLIQSKGKPDPRYLVRGLAIVIDWREGFFTLRGFDGRDEIEVPSWLAPAGLGIASTHRG